MAKILSEWHSRIRNVSAFLYFDHDSLFTYFRAYEVADCIRETIFLTNWTGLNRECLVSYWAIRRTKWQWFKTSAIFRLKILIYWWRLNTSILGSPWSSDCNEIFIELVQISSQSFGALKDFRYSRCLIRPTGILVFSESILEIQRLIGNHIFHLLWIYSFYVSAWGVCPDMKRYFWYDHAQKDDVQYSWVNCRHGFQCARSALLSKLVEIIVFFKTV